MVGFSDILGTGQVKDQKMIKDKLIDGKKLRVGLAVNQSIWLEMLVVNLMIIQLHLKLDKSYCIGVMNQQKKIFLMSCQINV